MDIYANRDRLIAPKEYYIDGVERTGDCGSSKIQDLVIPDSFYGCSIVEACKIHDYMYEVGDTIEHKRLADRVFYWNMMILVRRYSKCPFTNFFRFKLAKIYYEAVDEFGDDAFWEGKDPLKRMASKDHYYERFRKAFEHSINKALDRLKTPRNDEISKAD